MPNFGGPKEVKRQTCYTEKTVLGTERCSDEDYLSIPNCADEFCAGPGERSANRRIGEGKAGGISAPQGAYLFQQ